MKRWLCLISMFAAFTVLRAAAPADTPPPAASPVVQPDGSPVKGAASGKQPPASKTPRDDAVTIEDDPTIAPDPNQSADNNVTFPSDI